MMSVSSLRARICSPTTRRMAAACSVVSRGSSTALRRTSTRVASSSAWIVCERPRISSAAAWKRCVDWPNTCSISRAAWS